MGVRELMPGLLHELRDLTEVRATEIPRRLPHEAPVTTLLSRAVMAVAHAHAPEA